MPGGDSDSRSTVDVKPNLWPDPPPPTPDSEPVTPQPTPKEIIAAVVRMITFATARLQHTGRIAWTVSRHVAPTVEADQGLVRNELAARRDRKVIRRMAGEAADALTGLRIAIDEADIVRRRADDLIRDHRTHLADAERATTVAAAEAALELGEQIRKLHVPLGDLDAALDEARLRSHVIEASLTRRLHAVATVAIETQVDAVTARLRELRAEVEAVHIAALAPDATVAACRGALDAIGAGTLPLPRVIWPKWSSAGSKNPKGGWIGDMFAAPELEHPDTEA